MMTLNINESNHTLSHEPINVAVDTFDKETTESQTIETVMETDCAVESNKVEETSELTNEQQIRETIDNVLEQTEQKVSPSCKKKDKDHMESPKKRSKLSSKKDESPKSSSPLIRQPKLQINDKTLKKLRSDADDLIFDNEDEGTSNPELSVHQTCSNDKLNKNVNLVPVVNNVLSRSIAAIFKNSTINKNGEFNSYSALGYNKGPRVKRVCRTFSDVYRGLPRAVFPAQNKINKSSSTTNNGSNNGKRKSKKSKNKSSQSSPSTSKSNSNDSLDSDDFPITDYIERNMKKEMSSHESSKDVPI